MNILIRYAKAEDIRSIVNIYNESVLVGKKTADQVPWKVEERNDWFKKYSSENYPLIVAEVDEQVIGWLSISPYRAGRKALRFTAEVSYYLSFNYHGKGIGSKLLCYAIKKSKKLSIKTLFAILLSSNNESIGLLKKFKFEEWGRLPKVADFDGEEVDHLYFGLRILD